jgi:hypothetical protein
MCRRRAGLVFCLCALILIASGRTPLVSHAVAQSAVQSGLQPAPALSDQEIEAFLLTAKVVRTRPTAVGITNSRRATMTDGRLTHDAHLQTIDEFKPVFSTPTYTEVAFRDSYKFNIAAYHLARLLGLDNVPVSVARSVDGEPSSVTWWVDDVMMDETERQRKKANDPDPARGSHYRARMRVFDELIQNRDRNQGNVLFTSEWTMWLIDHTRAFRLLRELLMPDQLQRIERPLFERLQTLTADELQQAVGPHLERGQREALLARRNAIVAHFRTRIAELGEDRVLYTYPARRSD